MFVVSKLMTLDKVHPVQVRDRVSVALVEPNMLLPVCVGDVMRRMKCLLRIQHACNVRASASVQ